MLLAIVFWIRKQLFAYGSKLNLGVFMKAYLLIAVAAFVGASAQAKGIVCDSGAFSVMLGSGSIKIMNLPDYGNLNGTLDSKYRPQAKHAGSTRYVLEDTCDGSGENYAIVDKSLVKNGKGTLTIESNCDTDGAGPSFEVHNCTSK